MTAIQCMWCKKRAGISAEAAFRVDTIGVYLPPSLPDGWIVEKETIYPANSVSINPAPIGYTYSVFCSQDHRELWMIHHTNETEYELAEAKRLLGELVSDPRAGWGDEPFIECLYCGAKDYDNLEDGLQSHAEDCLITQARAFVEGE